MHVHSFSEPVAGPGDVTDPGQPLGFTCRSLKQIAEAEYFTQDKIEGVEIRITHCEICFEGFKVYLGNGDGVAFPSGDVENGVPAEAVGGRTQVFDRHLCAGKRFVGDAVKDCTGDGVIGQLRAD